MHSHTLTPTSIIMSSLSRWHRSSNVQMLAMLSVVCGSCTNKPADKAK
jgi:hypothetical protein